MNKMFYQVIILDDRDCINRYENFKFIGMDLHKYIEDQLKESDTKVVRINKFDRSMPISKEK